MGVPLIPEARVGMCVTNGEGDDQTWSDTNYSLLLVEQYCMIDDRHML